MTPSRSVRIAAALDAVRAAVGRSPALGQVDVLVLEIETLRRAERRMRRRLRYLEALVITDHPELVERARDLSEQQDQAERHQQGRRRGR